MKNKIRKILSVFFLITCFVNIYSEDDVTVEQLNELKSKGMISQEDYDILIADITGTLENEQLYKLNVNGILIDTRFKVVSKGDTMYFPLFKFLDLLGFFNVKQENQKVNISLNDGLAFEVDKETNTISSKTNENLNKKLKNEKDYFVKENDEYFLRDDVFKEIFLSSLVAEKNYTTIRMALGFNTPEEMSILFKVRQEDIKKELEKNEIIYTNERKLFELGNARVQLYQKFDKRSGESDYKKDWEGNLEYQGALLYGNLTTGFDFKKKTLNDIEIKYEDIYTSHDLTVGAYSVGDDSRAFGFSLKKDKGYYELGKKFIISESVPIGSKVELSYMGYPIEVKEAENGKVVFDNPLIRSDRSYQLKIYAPNGNVETKYINTAQNYNQQNKGEVEYNIDFKEDYESKKYSWNAQMFYGITDKYTLGLGNKRTPVKVLDEYKFLDEGRMELTYSNQVYNNLYPVTLRIGSDRTFTDGVDGSNQKYDDRYKYDGLAQVNIKDWSLKTEFEEFGKFYKEKSKNKYEIKYNGFNYFTLGYEREERKYRKDKDENENKYKINFDKGLTSNLLLSSEVKISDKNDEEYRMDFFYTGFDSFNVNWKNTWKKSISNYETELELYSNDFYGIIDYSLSMKYSEQLKERAVLSFTIDYDNFLKITGGAGEKGSRNIKVGVDRIVDLKNITKPLDSIDTSRVKVISFIDSNDNNIYDEGETRVDNVEVKIGNKSAVTDELGEAMFYGISNNVIMNLNPTIRKPSYSIGNNVIKVKGIAASTIEAYIPVKPMLTLNGSVELDRALKISPDEIQALYSDILIKVKDIKGDEIEVTMPDETGNFAVSGIFPDRYYIEIKYLGDRFNLPELKETLELVYIDSSSPKVVLNVNEKKFSLNKFLKGIGEI
ncbi:hypothetical protein [Cetobacterium sp.]|uniref:hypothetical protein n=1 Tax=Cetobacterium sp. TaxID=2071632 RepID=UPI003F307D99